MKKVIRISRASFDPQRADEVITLLQEMRAMIWPKQEQLAGYIDGYMGVDRQNSTMIWVTVWESLEHANALGALPEMRTSNASLQAQGVKFEPIATHELL